MLVGHVKIITIWNYNKNKDKSTKRNNYNKNSKRYKRF